MVAAIRLALSRVLVDTPDVTDATGVAPAAPAQSAPATELTSLAHARPRADGDVVVGARQRSAAAESVAAQRLARWPGFDPLVPGRRAIDDKARTQLPEASMNILAKGPSGPVYVGASSPTSPTTAVFFKNFPSDDTPQLQIYAYAKGDEMHAYEVGGAFLQAYGDAAFTDGKLGSSSFLGLPRSGSEALNADSTLPLAKDPSVAALLAKGDALRVQAFENGFLVDLGAGCLQAFDNSGKPTKTFRARDDVAAPLPGPRGLPTTIAEADGLHITQFRSRYNEKGPLSSTNCGPASLAMALAAKGKLPAGLSPEQRVDYARALMRPNDPGIKHITVDGKKIPLLDRDHQLTGGTMLLDGVRAAGLKAERGNGWAALDAALQAGKPVVASGYTSDAWRAQFPKDIGRYGSGYIGHLNAILGKTADGKYIVDDPMFTGGPVAMTRAELTKYFQPTGGVPAFNALA